jgi:hypothetical protein
MPLQNRVPRFGDIVAIPQWACVFTGDRGIIHDPASRALLKKRWATKAGRNVRFGRACISWRRCIRGRGVCKRPPTF